MIMRGSSPLLRIIASVFRESQALLWEISHFAAALRTTRAE
jgi:hypothetical protein